MLVAQMHLHRNFEAISYTEIAKYVHLPQNQLVQLKKPKK